MGEIEIADEEAPSPLQVRRQQQYRPVESHDKAVLQMSSLESSSGYPPRDVPLKYVYWMLCQKILFLGMRVE